MLENFMIVGHRGFRSQYPENTIPSFIAAMDYGLDSLEFDVHPTKDGKLVVTHDHTVERCSNGQGYVHDFLFDDIRKLDFGGWKDPKFAGTQIPTFEETLDAIFSKDPNYYILIELKEDDDNCTRQVYEICKKQNIFSHSLILSFHPRQLQLLKEWDPSIFIQCFPPRYLKCPVDEKLYGPVFNKICLWTKEATNEEIEEYHKKNVVVDICAVDTEAELDKALTLNCDSITTNSPDVIYPILRKLNLR
jgi:glycerophosphoryl diester phosphodiesterase